jgi:hypothetical protein
VKRGLFLFSQLIGFFDWQYVKPDQESLAEAVDAPDA